MQPKHCLIAWRLKSGTAKTVPAVPAAPALPSSSVVSLSAPSCTALTLDHGITEAIECLRFKLEDSPLLSECQMQVTLSVAAGASPQCIVGKSQGKSKSWLLKYSVVLLLMNSQLFAEYRRIANMLGCPPCSNTHWKTSLAGFLSMSLSCQNGFVNRCRKVSGHMEIRRHG